MEACVADWLTPQTLDLEVQGSSLALPVVSLDKKLYSTLSLFTQVYKRVLVTYYWELLCHGPCIPSMGGVAILLGNDASC